MFRRFLPTRALIKVLWWSLVMAAYSSLAVWKEQSRFANFADLPPGFEAALSLAIGLLLAFRVNRAFERWWEGRTLWGTLVNACRNLAVKVNNLVAHQDDSVRTLRRLLTAFPYALRDHLRSGAKLQNLPGFGDECVEVKHVPSWIVNQLYGLIEVWKRNQRIQYGEFWMMDRELKILLEVCGGCERIRNTPIVTSFGVFLNHALVAFFLTLPWGIVGALGIWTIPVSFLTAYFTVAAEGIAEHIEQPFGSDGDSLDLDAICDAIRSSVTEIFTTKTPAADLRDTVV